MTQSCDFIAPLDEAREGSATSPAACSHIIYPLCTSSPRLCIDRSFAVEPRCSGRLACEGNVWFPWQFGKKKIPPNDSDLGLCDVTSGALVFAAVAGNGQL
ncbi:hypothetical protein M9458_015695, partial [Cirrhinus mrigala]